MNDWELIQNYCRNGSESAFEALVKRHVDYVYCAALRQVRDPALAEDVSQAVFLLLAQKAKTFRPDTILVSWLFRTTHFIAARAMRSEYRRQRRELEAVKMNPTTITPETDHQWERVSPLLDEALAALPNKDRDAVLLRFMGRKSFSQVGADLGTSEDAAKKRVSRALARLREFFTRRGTTLSLAIIATLLGERVVQASPAALATKISATVVSGTAAAASSPAAVLLKTTLRELFWTKVKWGAAIGAGVVTALLVATSAVRSVHNQTTSSATATPIAQAETAINAQSAITTDSMAAENTTNRILILTVLRSEDQQPVPGARILVQCAMGGRLQRTLDATMGASGTLEIPIPTQTFGTLRVWVSAESRVPMFMDWQEHEFTEPSLSHTLLLEPGQAASGTVLDESGNPIPGAKVSFSGPGVDWGKRENRQFHPDLSASLTDANGRWTTTQSPGKGGIGIRVTSPDYTPVETGVAGLPGFPTNAILVLSNGVALAGRVSTTNGIPIPNARIAKQNGIQLTTRTDANGRFSWPHIEPGQVLVDVDAEGFETIHEFAWATNATNDCAFTLSPSSNPAQPTPASYGPRTRLHGTVVDAETGEPIPSFRVLTESRGFAPPSSSADALLANANLLGEGREGRFDWLVLSERNGGFRLQVEAEGYLAAVSEGRNTNDAEREFIFKLRPDAILTGRVAIPDGSAVENATVTFTGPNMGAMMQKSGELTDPIHGFETARTRTDHQGNFHLKLKTGARGIAVMHESGWALLTLEAATNAAILLQPWGAIDGTIYLDGKPAPNQTVYVGGTQKLDADPRVHFDFGYTGSSDEHGHFRFINVLPGEHSIMRMVGYAGGGESVTVNFDLNTKVKVESGAVASVQLRRHGRPVIGRIVFQGAHEDVRWASSEASLQGKEKFPFALAIDGGIRADDVPPGTYTLSVDLQSPSAEPLPFGKTFGSLQKEITVPSAEDESVPVDLGDLTITQAK